MYEQHTTHNTHRHWPHFFLPHAKNGDPVYVEVRQRAQIYIFT